MSDSWTNVFYVVAKTFIVSTSFAARSQTKDDLVISVCWQSKQFKLLRNAARLQIQEIEIQDTFRGWCPNNRIRSKYSKKSPLLISSWAETVFPTRALIVWLPTQLEDRTHTVEITKNKLLARRKAGSKSCNNNHYTVRIIIFIYCDNTTLCVGREWQQQQK